MSERDSGHGVEPLETQECKTKPIPPVWSFVRGFAMVGAGMTFVACDEEHTGMLLVGTGLLMLNHYRNRSKTRD